MKVLVSNVGSTSLKFKLFDLPEERVLCEAKVERVGNVEDAIYILDKFIDDAMLCSLHQIRIIHGKGTGILRNGIHQYLKKHPGIRTYHLAAFGEGDSGVTIAELK